MTDQKDYLRLPEVLAWLGWKREGFMGMVPDGKREKIVMRYNLIDATGINKGEHAQPTLSELWDGLKKARQARLDCSDTAVSIREFTDEETHKSEERVVLSGFVGLRWFCTSEYGSLPNAVAAALHWVLQQKEG